MSSTPRAQTLQHLFTMLLTFPASNIENIKMKELLAYKVLVLELFEDQIVDDDYFHIITIDNLKYL